MMRARSVANQKRGIDRRAGAQRDARETRARVRWKAEEVDEDAGASRLILIERQHDERALGERAQHGTRRFLLAKESRSAAAPHALDEAVDERVLDRLVHERDGMTE